MPSLSDLGNILVECRVVSRGRWDRAARAGGGEPAATLDILAAKTPEWWTPADGPEPLPGLTEYQRAVIDAWLDGDETPLARQLAVNKFLLLEKLGAGGQGEVFRGRQIAPPRFVAVKTLTRDTDTGRTRFEQEARAMMRVQHPAVARFYLYERVRDADNEPTDEYLIAMELVDGTDLHRLVRWAGPVAWPFAVKWAGDLLGGLAAIHASGFVHRDVKPANVIALGPLPEPGADPGDTAAKLLDFGAVSRGPARPSADPAKRIFVGTREYAPPEQWLEKVVPASDLYALGGTLFYVLTGQPPYVVEDRDAVAFMRLHTRAAVPSARDLNPDVPEPLGRLIQKMMAKRADDRGTAAELAREFAALLPGGAAVPPAAPGPARRLVKPAPPPTPTPKPFRAPDPDPRGPLDAALGPVLGVFERIFLPARLRPTPGHEPAAGERVATLLRRPAVLLLLITLIGLCIFLVAR